MRRPATTSIPVLASLPMLLVACSDGVVPSFPDVSVPGDDVGGGGDGGGTDTGDPLPIPDAGDDTTAPGEDTSGPGEDTTSPGEDTTEPADAATGDDAAEPADAAIGDDAAEPADAAIGDDAAEPTDAASGTDTTDATSGTDTTVPVDVGPGLDVSVDTGTDAAADAGSDTGVGLTPAERFENAVDFATAYAFCVESIACELPVGAGGANACVDGFVAFFGEGVGTFYEDNLAVDGCAEAYAAYIGCSFGEASCPAGTGPRALDPGEPDCGEPYESFIYACILGAQFTCGDSITTVPNLFVCDGDLDCAGASGVTTDLSDEIACDPPTIFVCNTGEVIPAFFVCDGDDDCPGAEDEDDCPEPVPFTCSNGAEIPEDWVCDGYPDCSLFGGLYGYDSNDLSDEADCDPPTETFACAGGGFIPAAWRCDGDDDCYDFHGDDSYSDEQDCPI
jgi:hypothetical protein